MRTQLMVRAYFFVMVLIGGSFFCIPETHAATLTATSCNVSDIQAKITQASNGDTVIIPNGACTWGSGISTSKQITLQGQSVNGVTITHGAGADTLLAFTLGTSYSTQIANLRFMPGTATGVYMQVDGTVSDKPALMHDVYFNLPDSQLAHAVRWYSKGGVIWNATFESTQNLSGACDDTIGSSSGSLKVTSPVPWNSASTMGTADTNGDTNLYIEDSVFSYVGQMPDVDTNGRVVIRHDQYINSSGLTHGVTSFVGGRHVELYDNTFRTSNINRRGGRYFWFRAGTGVITGNDVQAANQAPCHQNAQSFEFMVEDARRPGGYGCCTGYMCMQQVGSGSDGQIHSPPLTSSYATNQYQISEPFYLWGNTGTGTGSRLLGLNEGDPPDCGTTYSTADFFQQNRDYFMDSGAKPGWTRYTYPHPLRESGGGPDTTPPTLAQVTAIPSVSRDNTPNYTFSSTEAGAISYTGDCSSATTAATSGNNTVTFTTLARGTHSNCSLIVTDAATNPSSALSINSFTVSYTSDLNQDRNVNVLDFGILHTHYSTTNSAGDVNFDGTVNILDFGVMHTDYGKSV